MYTQTSDTNFRRVSPFNITPVKRAYKGRTCWYHWPFRLIYRYQVKEKYKKGLDRCNIKFKNIGSPKLLNTSDLQRSRLWWLLWEPSTCSVSSSLHSGMSRTVHPQKSSKVDVEQSYMRMWASHPLLTFDSSGASSCLLPEWQLVRKHNKKRTKCA